MATALGNILISNVAVGSSAATALALGSTVIWQGGEQPVPPTPTDKPWLCFTAEETNSTVKLNKGNFDISIETSTDGTTWTDYSWTNNTGDTLTLANVGDKVYFRAKNENQTFSAGQYNYCKFVGTGKFAASGNIQSLLKADCSRTDVPDYGFIKLFYECASLTTAPELPATTLGSTCYSSMFERCSSLTAAPATLPATTSNYLSYGNMFSYCTRLVEAPAISATTFDSFSCQNMFQGCSSLSSIKVAFTTWPGNSATSYWLYGVAASGTFTCPAGLPDTRGVDNIPTGWTKIDAV